ncbi:hypothetical protein Q9966_014004, partial [Columba livia]
ASVPSTQNQQLCDISPRATGTAGNARTAGTWLLHGWQRALGSCGCRVPLAAMNLLPLLVLLAVCWPAHGWDNCGNVTRWRVVLGATQLSRLGPEAQVRRIRQLLSHQHYDSNTDRNDIALLELDHPVQCNDYIQLACVADTTVRVSELTSCYVSGWGSTSARNAKASDVLQEAQVHLIDLQLCNSTWCLKGVILALDMML